LTEQQLLDLSIADMQALMAIALKNRSTEPTDTGAAHFLSLNECASQLLFSLLHSHQRQHWQTQMRSSLSQQSRLA
jgi:hypothetical protein